MTRPILPGRFEPIQFLRESPTLSTFHAADHTLRRSDVVVKVVRKGNFTKDSARLFRSFNWHRGLDHPHIARMLDAGITPSRDFYYVRPYLEKASMFDLRDIASLEKLLAAIDFLHSHDIVHGAIKPSNVFGEGPGVVLADPWLNQNWRKPETEEEVRFTAPEVLAGGVRTIEADLYSVGALVYRFHSGRDLFDDADLDSLARKYSWAAPRPLAAICHASRAVSEIVTEMVHKDPACRRPAFAALKDEMRFRQSPSSRAPALGLESLVEQGHRVLSSQARGKRMVLIEGAAGSGKTRLVEELRQRFGFQTPSPTVEVCTPVGKLHEQGLARWIVTLYEERYPAYEEELSVQRLTTGASEGEQLHHDVIAVMEVMARRAPILFVFEDVDRANKGVLRFLETASRSATLPAPIVVTTRPFGVPQRSMRCLESGFGLVKLEVPLLGLEDSRVIASFLVLDSQQQESVALRAGGNPLFLEAYCTSAGDRVPVRVRRTIGRWIQHLPQRVRRTAELLSIYEHAMSVPALHDITGIPESDLTEDLAYLQRISLADTSVALRYRDARLQLYSKLAKAPRRELHARSFEYFKDKDCAKGDLARHAHLGGLVEPATRLYLELASNAYTARDFRSAASFYELAEECAGSAGAELIESHHKLNLAHSYSEVAEVDKARALLKDLLNSPAIQTHPEHLGRAYMYMARDTVARSKADQKTFFNEALRYFPRSSSRLPFCYLGLALFHLKTGDDDAAEQAIRAAIALRKGRGGLRIAIKEALASLHSFRGDFKSVKRVLWPIRFEKSAVVSANNLAVCMEYLGDIHGAIEVQEFVLRYAVSMDSQLLEILSLVNLASMEAKLGRMQSAQSRFAVATRKLESSSALDTPLISLYVDVALHSQQLGFYQLAFDCLERVARRGAGPFQIEVVNFGLARCELYLEIGQTEAAKRALDEITVGGPYRNKFIETETVLMAVRCNQLQSESLTQLDEAVSTSSRLGTLHQHCRALLELARASWSLSEVAKASHAARRANQLAKKHGYRPLVVRSSLLLASVEDNSAIREALLTEGLQEASRMGLRPLLVNCLHQLGVYYSDEGDYWQSLQCLREGVDLIHRLAENLRASDRKTYFARPDFRGMKELLEGVEKRVSPGSYISRVPTDKAPFFTGLYRIASTLRTGMAPETKKAILIECLRELIRHPVFIVSHDAQGRMTLIGTGNVPADSLRKRILSAAENSAQRPTFSRINEPTKGSDSLWIPFGRLWPGGVYTEWSSNHSIDERQIDFLTVVAALVGPSLDYLDSTHRPGPIRQMEGIVGASRRMQAVYGLIDSAASSKATVLIEGESGTGKELIAQAIHRRSARATGPFVPIDCGGLPESLIDAELFGAAKGSYTGAIGDRIGLFEAANGGTLFLDEIGNASPALQTRLLRVLQEREVRRVGGTSVRQLDIRLIAATNSDLRSLVNEGKFRRDLLYRLLVLHITVPPLRQRLEDIPMLATAFLDRLNREYSQTKQFSQEVFHYLVAHTYPGNVRELQNAIERAYFTAEGRVIREVHLDIESAVPGPRNNIQVLFRDLTQGRIDFWRSVHDSYRRRDVPRETVVGLLDLGLRATQGSYKGVAALFRIEGRHYRRFMDFLRRNRCLLDFRPYRELTPAIPVN